MPRPDRRYKITANLFGIPLGLCGLAQCWTTAGNLDITPRWPADVLWATAAAVWVVVASAYFGRYYRSTTWPVNLPTRSSAHSFQCQRSCRCCWLQPWPDMHPRLGMS